MFSKGTGVYLISLLAAVLFDKKGIETVQKLARVLLPVDKIKKKTFRNLPSVLE